MSNFFGIKFILNNNIEECKNFYNLKFNEGKSLYEVIRIIDGVPLFLEEHLERLENSAKVVSLKLWMKKDEIKTKIYELCKANNKLIGNIKLIFNYKDNGDNNFYAFFIKHKYPSRDMYEFGVDTSLYHAERQNPNAKVVDSKLRENTNKFIEEKHIYEAILVDNDGYITEGSRSNIFCIEDNTVITSPIKDVLPGITRKHILKVCNDLGIKVQEKRIHYTNISKMKAFFICGTSPKVLPIKRIDEFFYDTDDKILQSIKNGYDDIIKQYVDSNKIFEL